MSIATLTGENGILTKATKSKEETQKATAEEKVQLEALGSYDNSGNLDMSMLKENLKKNLGLTDADITDNSDGGITVKIDGYDVVVEPNGNVIRKEWIQTGTSITNGTVTLEVGDYVNYNHLAGVDTTNTDVTTYTSASANNGYADQVFNINSYTGKWRVLGEDGGKLLLISSDIIGPDSGGYVDETNGNKFYLRGQAGYINCVSELDKISSKYGQGTYADGARSVTVEDINKITGYNPNNVGVKDLSQTGSGTKYGAGQIYEYGNEVTYTLTGGKVAYSSANGSGTSNYTKFDYYDKVSNLFQSLGEGESKKYTNNFYSYYPETLTNTSNSSATTGIAQSSAAYDTLFANTTSKYYWLGSQYVNVGSGDVNFGVWNVYNALVSSYSLYCSSVDARHYYRGVRPAVSLKSNLQFTKNGDEWVISQ